VIISWEVNIPHRTKPFERDSKLLRPASQRNVADQEANRTLVTSPSTATTTATTIASPRRRAPSPAAMSSPWRAMVRRAVPPHCCWYLHRGIWNVDSVLSIVAHHGVWQGNPGWRVHHHVTKESRTNQDVRTYVKSVN